MFKFNWISYFLPSDEIEIKSNTLFPPHLSSMPWNPPPLLFCCIVGTCILHAKNISVHWYELLTCSGWLSPRCWHTSKFCCMSHYMEFSKADFHFIECVVCTSTSWSPVWSDRETQLLLVTNRTSPGTLNSTHCNGEKMCEVNPSKKGAQCRYLVPLLRN